VASFAIPYPTLRLVLFPLGQNHESYFLVFLQVKLISNSFQIEVLGLDSNHPLHGTTDQFFNGEIRPLEAHLKSREQPKLLGERSGEYDGREMAGMIFSARNCCITSNVFLGTLL
jgi:hypothetical protein